MYAWHGWHNAEAGLLDNHETHASRNCALLELVGHLLHARVHGRQKQATCAESCLRFRHAAYVPHDGLQWSIHHPLQDESGAEI